MWIVSATSGGVEAHRSEMSQTRTVRTKKQFVTSAHCPNSATFQFLVMSDAGRSRRPQDLCARNSVRAAYRSYQFEPCMSVRPQGLHASCPPKSLPTYCTYL